MTENKFFPEIHGNFGFGCMRLPMKDGAVDHELFCRMADAFIAAGLNYFDTAHGYLGGKSETAIREAVVKRYPRESFYLTSKNAAWANKKSADKFIKTQNLLKVIVPAAGFILLLVIVYSVIMVLNVKRQGRLKELNKVNSDPATVENAKRYEEITDVITGVGSRQGGLNIFHKYIDSYPIPDSSVNKVMKEAAKKYGVKVIFNSYDADSGVFSITAQSTEVEKINQFIADLMKMDTFEKVDYTGYNAIDDIDGQKGWQINVVCTLAARNAETKNAEEEA